jgi:predicted esterase
MRSQLDFIHEFVPGAFNQTLLLLHGTGGNKRDLLPLGGELDLSSVAGLGRRRLHVFVALLRLIPDPRIDPEVEGFGPMK